MLNIVHLHQPPPQIAHYMRIGFREHVLGDRMRVEGWFAEQGFVFEACYADIQSDLIQDIRSEGRELILDTNPFAPAATLPSTVASRNSIIRTRT